MVEELCNVAWNNEVPTLQILLSLPCYQNVINLPNQRGQCALYCASRKGNSDIVMTLLKCPKIDVNFQVAEHGGTPLHAASFGGKPEIVVLLLSRGADINLKNKLGLTARQEAHGKDMMDLYKALEGGGLDKVKKQFPSVMKLEKELGKANVSSLAHGSASSEIQRSTRSSIYPPEIMWIWYEHFAERLDILDLSPIEVAQQLTLLDYKFFDSIRPYELLSGGYAKADKELSAPNICKCTTYFNLVASWVSTEILKVPDLQSRQVVLTFMIEVLQNLIKYNNLASAFAVQLALRTAAIWRLTETLSGISDYLQQYVQVVVELCNPEHNFDKLRKHLEDHPAPGIPYLGMFLKDLIFINDGNKDGPSKDAMIQGVLDQVASWQKQQPPFKTIPRIQNLLGNVWSLEEEKRFNISLLLEPRKKTDISTQEERDEEERKKEEALLKAKYLLGGEIARSEESHYKLVTEKANINNMLSIISDTASDLSIPSKDGYVSTHKLLISPRVPFLVEVLESDGECSLDTWKLLQMASMAVIQSLLQYIIRDEPQLDQLSTEDLFDLLNIATSLRLNHLEELIYVFITYSQTKQNVLVYAMLQIKHDNFRCFKTTNGLLKKNVNLIYSSSIEFKSQLQAAMKKWETEQPPEIPLSVPPSTWLADYKPLLQRKILTDLEIIVRDIFGKEQRFSVHRSILKSQLNLKKTFMGRFREEEEKASPRMETRRSRVAFSVGNNPSASPREVPPKFSPKENQKDFAQCKRTLTVDVTIPISTFVKILDYAYTRHFGELSGRDKIFILGATSSLTFHNMSGICSLLLLDVKQKTRGGEGEIIDQLKGDIEKMSDIKKCAALRSALQFSFTSHPIIKLFTDHVVQLYHAHALLLPSITAATEQLNARIAELEEENSKLKSELGTLTNGTHPLLNRPERSNTPQEDKKKMGALDDFGLSFEPLSLDELLGREAESYIPSTSTTTSLSSTYTPSSSSASLTSTYTPSSTPSLTSTYTPTTSSLTPTTSTASLAPSHFATTNTSTNTHTSTATSVPGSQSTSASAVNSSPSTGHLAPSGSLRNLSTTPAHLSTNPTPSTPTSLPASAFASVSGSASAPSPASAFALNSSSSALRNLGATPAHFATNPTPSSVYSQSFESPRNENDFWSSQEAQQQNLNGDMGDVYFEPRQVPSDFVTSAPSSPHIAVGGPPKRPTGPPQRPTMGPKSGTPNDPASCKPRGTWPTPTHNTNGNANINGNGKVGM
eukprot:TRINITY_DN8597_c0_g1_i1.p1 TRINITY_DN8597_c0_g1~~TRINITY_DN8597_c0_g1_i1.p1  ORF type:complete len:1344 (-),score=258.35 TRINITY_DN8597_c0_g1_i1:145-3867(-)